MKDEQELYKAILAIRGRYDIDHYPPAYWKEVAVLAINWSKPQEVQSLGGCLVERA